MVSVSFIQGVERFLAVNPGLYRRFDKIFFFEDYGPAELARIFVSSASKDGYTLGCDVSEHVVTEPISAKTTAEWRSGLNAAISEQLLRGCKDSLDERLDWASATKEQITTIQLFDVEQALQTLALASTPRSSDETPPPPRGKPSRPALTASPRIPRVQLF